jgi:hypothetical protein
VTASRVARWYILKPKIPIWVNFGGPWNGQGWDILGSFGIFNILFDDLVAIWFIFPRFGKFFQEKSGNPDCFYPNEEWPCIAHVCSGVHEKSLRTNLKIKVISLNKSRHLLLHIMRAYLCT